MLACGGAQFLPVPVAPETAAKMDGNLSAGQALATRFVAGDTLDQALGVGRHVNSEGIAITLDHLGESVTSLEEAAEARDVYLHALSAIHDSGIQGNVSLKLTQFGLDFSYDQCRANVEQLVRRAASLNTFVRVDMESSAVHPAHHRDGGGPSRAIRSRRHGDSGLPLSQPERYRGAVPPRHPRAALQRRLPRTRQRGLPPQVRRGPQLRRADAAPAGPRRLPRHCHAR